MTRDLTPSMEDTLLTLCAATAPTGGARWTGLDGLAVHKGSIYALEDRGLVIWNGYRQRAKVTAAGWEEAAAR